MTRDEDFTTPNDGSQNRRNPNNRTAVNYLETIRAILLPLRQLEAAITQSLTHPIHRLQTASLVQRLYDTSVAEIIDLNQPEDDAELMALLEWRELPANQGGADA